MSNQPHTGVAPKLSLDNSIAIWTLITSAFVTLLNETVMGVALPVLMHELNVTAVIGQWLTTGFLLTMAVVIPITGMLIQRFTTRQLFITANAAFVFGTALAAAAPNFSLLLTGRVIQAAGTAVMLPLLMTMCVTVVPPQIRGQIMGRIAVVMSLAPAIGPMISGLILHSLSWRWMFIIVIPISGAVLAVGAWKLRNVGKTQSVRIDVLSVLLSVFGFGGIVYGLSQLGEGAEHGATSAPWIPLTIGSIALALFTWRQISLIRADRAPLLDLRVFFVRPFTLSLLLLCLSMMAMFGMVILLPIFANGVLGLEVLIIGLIMLPGGLLQAALGPIVGRIVDRFGARPVLIPGMCFTAASMWVFSLANEHSPLWLLVLAHLLLSVGLAGTFTPLFAAGMGSLPHEIASHGSATLSTLQQVAGGAGTALYISVMALGSAAKASEIGDAGESILQSPEVLTAGSHLAFLVGAIIATVAIFVAPFVKEETPAVSEDAQA